jgi:hypothetical protein
MNSTISLITLLVVATAQMSSALLFSPHLLQAKPFGVVPCNQGTRTYKASSDLPQLSAPTNVDYGHDDDIMRVKYELLQSVYEKSMTRGFDNQD